MFCLLGKKRIWIQTFVVKIWVKRQPLFCGYWGNKTSTGAYTMSEWKKCQASTRKVLSYSKALLMRFQSQPAIRTPMCKRTRLSKPHMARLFIQPCSLPFTSRSARQQGKSNKWLHSPRDMSKGKQRSKHLQIHIAIFLPSFPPVGNSEGFKEYNCYFLS